MPRYEDDITAGRKVYVGNLDPDVTSVELDDIFRRYGKISNIWVARNPPGFAFVTFDDPRDALDAVKATDGIRHRDKCIRVEIAKGPGAKGRRSSPSGYRYRGSPEVYRGDSYRDRERRRSPVYRSDGSDYGDGKYRDSYSGRDDYGRRRRGRSRSRSRSRSRDRRRSYSPGRREESVDSRVSGRGSSRRD